VMIVLYVEFGLLRDLIVEILCLEE
jgi:hypothetical protein